MSRCSHSLTTWVNASVCRLALTLAHDAAMQPTSKLQTCRNGFIMLTHHTCTTEIEEVFGTGTRLKSLNKAISRQSSHRCHNMTPAYYYYFITAGIATSMLPWDRERQGYVRAGPLRCHLHEQPQHLGFLSKEEHGGGRFVALVRCMQGRDAVPRGRDQSLPSHADSYSPRSSRH